MELLRGHFEPPRRLIDKQMAAFLSEADRASVPEVARKYRVSEHTIYSQC